MTLQADPTWFTTLLPQFPMLAVAVGIAVISRKACKEDMAEVRKENRHTINVILSVFEAALAKDDPQRARDLIREVRTSVGDEHERQSR